MKEEVLENSRFLKCETWKCQHLIQYLLWYSWHWALSTVLIDLAQLAFLTVRATATAKYNFTGQGNYWIKENTKLTFIPGLVDLKEHFLTCFHKIYCEVLRELFWNWPKWKSPSHNTLASCMLQPQWYHHNTEIWLWISVHVENGPGKII